MIDISKCPRGIEMQGMAFSHASNELARAQNRNLAIFKWMGNEMLKMSKQIDDLQKEIEALRGGKNGNK